MGYIEDTIYHNTMACFLFQLCIVTFYFDDHNFEGCPI